MSIDYKRSLLLDVERLYNKISEDLHNDYVSLVTKHLENNDKDAALSVLTSMPAGMSEKTVSALIAQYTNKTTESYKDGYITGMTWKDDYRPGGPFAYNEEGGIKNKEWLTGFDDAIKKRNYKFGCPTIHKN